MEGYCKVTSCRNCGKWYKNLSKHIQREHKGLTLHQHRRLPPVKTKSEATSMKYRYRETCKLCGKFVLLLPHIKRIHKIFSKVEYETVVNGGISNLASPESPMLNFHSMKYIGREEPSGLHNMANSFKPTSKKIKCAHSQSKNILNRKTTDTLDSMVENVDDQLSAGDLNIEFPSWQLLRFCIHQLDLFKMVFVNLKVKTSVENGENVSSLCKRMAACSFLDVSSEELCRTIVLLRKHLLRYFCYPVYTYPYPRFDWTDEFDNQGPYPKEFYLYCREPCSKSFNCEKCKSWGSGYHTCWSFMTCSVCDVK